MKSLNPFIHKHRPELTGGALRLAEVRGIVEGTQPTGRVLRCQPWREFRCTPPLPPKWIAVSNQLQALRALNLSGHGAAKTLF